MLKFIDHIGIAVRNLDESLQPWRLLGLSEIAVEELPEHGVRVAMLPVGDGKVELLEPFGEDSPVGKFIASNGPGLHHIAFRVDDLAAALESARQQGLSLIDQVPRRGAGGALIAFLHPRSLGGILVELCQR